MERLIKTFSVLALATIMLICSVQVVAQTSGQGMAGNTSGMLSVQQSNRDIMTTLMGMNDTITARSMIVTAGMDRTMGQGIHTVFVPGDPAIKDMYFNQSQIATMTDNAQSAATVMQGLVTSGMVMPGAFARGGTITMLDGRTMTLSQKDGTLMLSGSRVTKGIQATNGMIYVIDSVPGELVNRT